MSDYARIIEPFGFIKEIKQDFAADGVDTILGGTTDVVEICNLGR